MGERKQPFWPEEPFCGRFRRLLFMYVGFSVFLLRGVFFCNRSSCVILQAPCGCALDYWCAPLCVLRVMQCL